MKRLVLSSVAVAAAALTPAAAGAGSSFAPALVRSAVVRPAPAKPALVKPALVKPAVAAEWCSHRPDGDCTLAPLQASSGSAKSASAQPKVVPRPAADPRGRGGWRSGSWYLE